MMAKWWNALRSVSSCKNVSCSGRSVVGTETLLKKESARAGDARSSRWRRWPPTAAGRCLVRACPKPHQSTYAEPLRVLPPKPLQMPQQLQSASTFGPAPARPGSRVGAQCAQSPDPTQTQSTAAKHGTAGVAAARESLVLGSGHWATLGHYSRLGPPRAACTATVTPRTVARATAPGRRRRRCALRSRRLAAW